MIFNYIFPLARRVLTLLLLMDSLGLLTPSRSRDVSVLRASRFALSLTSRSGDATPLNALASAPDNAVSRPSFCAASLISLIASLSLWVRIMHGLGLYDSGGGL